MFVKIAVQKYFSNYSGIPKNCWQGILFNLINAISIGVCFFLSLYFVGTLHLNMVIVGLLMSSYGTGTVIGGMLSGRLCDNLPHHWILFISLILQGAAFYFLANSNSVKFLIIILSMMGISAYSFKTANNVSMLGYCNNNQELELKTINIAHAASNLGLGISGVFIGLLAMFSYKIIFYIASGILFFLSIYILAFIKKSGMVEKNQQETQSAIEVNSNFKTSRIKILLLVLLSVFSVGLIIAQLGSTYPVYIKMAFPDLGVKAVSILFILDTVLIVLFQAPLANLYRRYNTMLVMGMGAFMMGLGMLLLIFSSTFVLALLSCCIWTTGEMLFLPTAQLLCYQNGDKKKKGQNMGMFQSTYAVSTVIGPAIGGFAYNTIHPNTMWYISAIIGIGCLCSCMILAKNESNS